jgi:DNA phosphorothioation-associated putative methyltransferase
MIERHRTAMARSSLSKPVSLALQQGILNPQQSFFDYGCGRGGDIKRLSEDGFNATGWDPAHAPNTPKTPADIVNLGYVINVIEDPRERVETLEAAWQLTQEVLVVAARPDWEASSIQGKPFRDGFLTSTGTFQRFYAQHELKDWIEAILETVAVAAAPGIFFVFRDQVKAQSFLASRVRYRSLGIRVAKPKHSEILYETHKTLLEPLIDFVLTRGRAPEAKEISTGEALIAALGSIKSAFTLVRRVSGDDAWITAQDRAKQDLSVILALQAFKGRPKFERLPQDLQLDIKAFFGNYKAACSEADQLLFLAGNQKAISEACTQSKLGKLTVEALYVHTNALGELTPLLRVYEGCAQVLTGFVEGTTLIKLGRLEAKVSYLAYPDFDTDAHPALAISVRADLRRLDVKLRDYRSSSNPPVLHRKETFVPPNYPLFDKFQRLTKQEERAKLLEETNTIGTRIGWQVRLEQLGYVVKGHRLLKAKRTTDVTREPLE